jgi:hypothetical protein
MSEDRLIPILLEVHRNCWNNIQKLRLVDGLPDTHWKLTGAHRFRKGLEYHMDLLTPSDLLEELPIHLKS